MHISRQIMSHFKNKFTRRKTKRNWEMWFYLMQLEKATAIRQIGFLMKKEIRINGLMIWDQNWLMTCGYPLKLLIGRFWARKSLKFTTSKQQSRWDFIEDSHKVKWPWNEKEARNCQAIKIIWSMKKFQTHYIQNDDKQSVNIWTVH